MKNLQQSLDILEKEIKITSSFGYAYSSNKHVYGPDMLLKMADIAMHQAKKQGKGRCLAFTPDMAMATKREKEIYQGLQSVIKNNEFEMFYQAQHFTHNNEIFGYEALLRWNSNSLGKVYPNEFIKIAETRNKMHTIGDWVLKQVFYDLKQINNDNPNIVISLNISSIQLQNIDFAKKVKSYIKELEINPKNIIFEITETTIITNIKIVEKLILSLTAIGIRFALDDFGTGYSSLNLLRDLDVFAIKIDKTFINGIEKVYADRIIVQNIINFSKQLGIVCIAEGVETEAQLNLLKNLGCDLAQGYYFSKPAPTKSLFSKASELVVE